MNCNVLDKLSESEDQKSATLMNELKTIAALSSPQHDTAPLWIQIYLYNEVRLPHSPNS